MTVRLEIEAKRNTVNYKAKSFFERPLVFAVRLLNHIPKTVGLCVSIEWP
jgi:hypothetical protein